MGAGCAGEMEYLKRVDEHGGLVRGSLRRAMPWARSVIVFAVNYNADGPRSIDPAEAGAGWIARYAWSGDSGLEGDVEGGAQHEGGTRASDYHDVLLLRLKVVERELRERVGASSNGGNGGNTTNTRNTRNTGNGGDGGDVETRCYVDTGPVVERSYTARAGVGWIGKNTCVLREGMGSWLLLGVIVTSLPVEKEAWAMPAADRCGSCTRCIDACPTGALVGARQMDASLCIAYLTIEKKGAIDEDLREKMGRQVFGCDICQDVCPWNRRAPIGAGTVRGEMVNPALEWLAEMDAEGFRRWFKGSPVERTTRKRLHRNVAIAMGNSGEKRFLPKLREWAMGEDAVLAESAKWAVERIEGRE